MTSEQLADGFALTLGDISLSKKNKNRITTLSLFLLFF